MNKQDQSREDGASTPGRQRASAAYDACRARKVKCNIGPEASKCSTCVELEIECTRVKPRKKRGPKNRYVEALRARLDHGQDLACPLACIAPPEPLLPTNSGLELIAPRTILFQIIDDWFDWIHPVAPIFHRAQFVQRIDSNETAGDATFQILVASICAATVASLRRRRDLYGPVTVDHCLDVAERLGLWDRASTMSLERCLVMYNFSSALHHEHGIDGPLTHRLSAEAAIGIKYLLYHGLDRLSVLEQQIAKRLYWLIFAGQCTCDMHGRPMLVLRHAHEQVNALIPADVPDDHLLPGVAEGQETSFPRSYVAGLNALSRLFLIWQSSQATPLKTTEHLQEHIEQSQKALDDLRPELKWRSRPSSPMSGEYRTHGGDFGTDVQTVNLEVTQLHIRANLLEQLHGLAKAQNILVIPIFTEERHRVVEELLDILYVTLQSHPRDLWTPKYIVSSADSFLQSTQSPTLIPRTRYVTVMSPAIAI